MNVKQLEFGICCRLRFANPSSNQSVLSAMDNTGHLVFIELSIIILGLVVDVNILYLREQRCRLIEMPSYLR